LCRKGLGNESISVGLLGRKKNGIKRRDVEEATNYNVKNKTDHNSENSKNRRGAGKKRAPKGGTLKEEMNLLDPHSLWH